MKIKKFNYPKESKIYAIYNQIYNEHQKLYNRMHQKNVGHIHECIRFIQNDQIFKEYLIEFIEMFPDSINEKNYLGETPLIIASKFHWKDVNICEFLLNLGADVNQTDNKKMTPLMYSVKKKQYKNFEIMMKFNPDINLTCNNVNVMFFCLYFWHGTNYTEKMIDLLFEKNIDFNQKSKSVVLEFIRQNSGFDISSLEYRIRILNKFFDRGYNLHEISKRGNNFIHKLIKNPLENHLDLFEYFISKGLDINDKNYEGHNYFEFAIKHLSNHTPNILNFLLDYKIELNVGKWFNLLINSMNKAEDTNLTEILKILVQNGFNIFQKDLDGNTLLFYACGLNKLKFFKTVKYLIDIGLPTDEKNNYDMYPLSYALKSSFIMSKKLIECINLNDEMILEIINTNNAFLISTLFLKLRIPRDDMVILLKKEDKEEMSKIYELGLNIEFYNSYNRKMIVEHLAKSNLKREELNYNFKCMRSKYVDYKLCTEIYNNFQKILLNL